MDPIDTNNESVSIAKEKMSNVLTSIDTSLSLHDFRMTPSGEKQTNLIFDVVVPSNIKIPKKELRKKIEEGATGVDKTFKCVITFDNDFTGH